MTKNIGVGSFFKNKKIKERPNPPAVEAGHPAFSGKIWTAESAEGETSSAVWLLMMKISPDVSDRWSPMIENESSSRKIGTSCFALLTMLSDNRLDELTRPKPLPEILTAQSGRTSDPLVDAPTRPDAWSTLTATASRRIDVPIAIGMTIFVVLLKTRVFPEFFVEKTFELRSEVCDMIGHLPFFGWCPFLFYPHQRKPLPPKSTAQGDKRTQKKTAARHPKGLLWVRWFGSIFFTPPTSRVGSVGYSKGKGKLNTIKKYKILVNLPLRLLALGWAKAGKMKETVFGGFFILWVGVLRLQKLVHPEGCVLLQLQDEALDKKCDKIRGFTFYSFWTQKGWVLFFGVCFCLVGWICSLLLRPLNFIFLKVQIVKGK